LDRLSIIGVFANVSPKLPIVGFRSSIAINKIFGFRVSDWATEIRDDIRAEKHKTKFFTFIYFLL
jgi:hypothetical protein